jgi:fumarylacetoacetase
LRSDFKRDAADPLPLPYLSSDMNKQAGAFDVQLQVLLSTEQSRAKGASPAVLANSNFKEAYWSIAQMITHHTVNGCNLQAGDLLGTGTLSGPEVGQEGSLLELNHGGKTPIDLPWGEQRVFLQDHDEIIMRAQCQKPGYPTISLGQCAGTVLPAKP